MTTVNGRCGPPDPNDWFYEGLITFFVAAPIPLAVLFAGIIIYFEL